MTSEYLPVLQDVCFLIGWPTWTVKGIVHELSASGHFAKAVVWKQYKSMAHTAHSPRRISDHEAACIMRCHLIAWLEQRRHHVYAYWGVIGKDPVSYGCRQGDDMPLTRDHVTFDAALCAGVRLLAKEQR